MKGIYKSTTKYEPNRKLANVREGQFTFKSKTKRSNTTFVGGKLIPNVQTKNMDCW